MNDPERVRLGDGFARLQHIVHGLLDGEATAGVELAREVAAGKELHHHEWRAVLQRADVEHPSDVLALDADGGFRFSKEPLDRLPMLAELGHQNLDRDALLELQMHRGHDVPHAALAEHALHPIFVGEQVVLPYHTLSHTIDLG